MTCRCVPEGEFEEMLEHVPLSTRRKLILSSTVSFENRVKSSNSPGLPSLPPCTAGDHVDQHLNKEHSPNCKDTADTFEVAINEHPLDSGAVALCSHYATSCQDVGLPVNGNSQESQAHKLTGTETNADASGLEEINVGAPLPPNPVMPSVSDIIRVDCADNMLLSLPKDDTNSLAGTGVISSCQDVGLVITSNNQGSQADQLEGNKADADANADAYGLEGDADASGLEKIDIVPLPANPVPSNVSAIENVACADNLPLSLSKDDTNSSARNGLIAVNTMDKKLSDFTFDELDHIVLKERRKLLQKRKVAELEKPAIEATSVGSAEYLMEYSGSRIKQELQPIDGECMTARNQFNDIPVRSASDLSSFLVNGSSSLEYSAGRNKEEHQNVDGESWSAGNKFKDIPSKSSSDLQRTSATGTEASSSGKRMEESNIICSYKFKSCDGDDYVPTSINNITLNTSVKVKVEPLDNNKLQNPERSSSANMVSMKCEEDISDGMDYMPLRDRMKLLTSVEELELNSSKNFECLRKTESASSGFSPIFSESVETFRVNRPRKRKKTATDSVVTALEEDAPGLLKVLLDQGVSVNEIKLYGESENDDALDESFNEDSFSELEDVMTKLFSNRNSLLRFATVQCAKGSKPSYCVACLFSLVEQTRYLQFRKWPVEWGWCRDLQSFIFVFKRHHRIVLERPEYGFATYFFELVDSLPIDWQLKRLVTAMKLTSCGRITLIENTPLSVGEDLTEGEAKVLMGYGWIPNTGLGTMLNYRDRVVHDRKNESEISEWRSKIGKLLIDGYNGGAIVSTSLAEDITEYKHGENTRVKLESDQRYDP